jgi:hypothetical protein
MLIQIYDLRVMASPPPRNPSINHGGISDRQTRALTGEAQPVEDGRLDLLEWRSDISYAEGWTDYAGMGFAAGSVLEVDSTCLSNPDLYTVVEAERPEDLAKLLRHDALRYGFNSTAFVDRLMFGLGYPIFAGADVLSMVLACAEPLGCSYWQSGRGYSQARICRANDITPPLGQAECAVLWQMGSDREVLTECGRSVWATAQILSRLLSGELINPNTQEPIFPPF